MSLILDEVSVELGGRFVLRNLSLRLDPGEVVVVMGPSGAGKTTLLSVVAGTRWPDGGRRRLEIDEVDGSGRSEVAWIFQTSPVLMRRNALDNVALGPLCRGIEPFTARSRAAEALRLLGIDALAGQRLFRLSGGERQRVAIARALAAGAGVVVADEPSASLDAVNRAIVCDALGAVATEGAIVLVATHDQAVADRFDRVIRLDGGRVVDAP